MNQRWPVKIATKLGEGAIRAIDAMRHGFLKGPMDGNDASRLLSEACPQLPPSLATPWQGRLLVLIPFRDAWPVTERCLASLVTQKLPAGCHALVVLIDNGSAQEETHRGLKEWDGRQEGPWSLTAWHANYPFNFSRLMNDAARHFMAAEDKAVLLLNNDTEMRQDDTVLRLTNLLASDAKNGIASGTLLYPDGRIQHLCAIPGIKIVAAHPLRGLMPMPHWAWFAGPREVPAVTGACLLMRRQAWDQVQGMDEELPTVGQDIDLCLAARSKGFRVVVDPAALVIHHEGYSRSGDIARHEVARLYDKWPERLRDDAGPLSRWSEKPTRALPCEPPYPWRFLLK